MVSAAYPHRLVTRLTGECRVLEKIFLKGLLNWTLVQSFISSSLTCDRNCKYLPMVVTYSTLCLVNKTTARDDSWCLQGPGGCKYTAQDASARASV